VRVRTRRERMVRWHALVVAKASGADTDSMNWIRTTTHLQKTASMAPLDTPIFVFSVRVVLFLMCARALRYCSMCTMSQMVAQQVCGEGCYTQSRPFGRLDLREVCGERHRCSTCTAFGAQLQISSCRCLSGANAQNRWNSADARHKAAKEAETLKTVEAQHCQRELEAQTIANYSL
jgi:hypothetical protein